MVRYYNFTTFNFVFYNFHPFYKLRMLILRDVASFESRIRDLSVNERSGHLTEASPPWQNSNQKPHPWVKMLAKPRGCRGGGGGVVVTGQCDTCIIMTNLVGQRMYGFIVNVALNSCKY